MGKHPPPTCNSPAYPNPWPTSGELLTHAERWQDVVREKFFTVLLGRWAEGSKKSPVSFPRSFFLGRDDKYPSHLMTVAHILCDEMLPSKGDWHLREVSCTLRLSRMLVTVPGTSSPVSELSAFPSIWCRALPALLPQQTQSWEVEGSAVGFKPVASAQRGKGAVCLVSHSFVQTFPEISGFAHFHKFFTFASCAEDVLPTDPWVPGSKRAEAVRHPSPPNPLSFLETTKFYTICSAHLQR